MEWNNIVKASRFPYAFSRENLINLYKVNGNVPFTMTLNDYLRTVLNMTGYVYCQIFFQKVQ
jgi:hypothetical protein